MNRQRVAFTFTMLLLFFAAGDLCWRAIRSPQIVRAQQSATAPAAQAQTPPQQVGIVRCPPSASSCRRLD